jgi:signal transduction histidine kinase
MAIELTLAEERERGRIAGELHDQVGQRLILGKIRLDGLMAELIHPEKIAEAEAVKELLSQSINDIRSLTFQLRPPVLANAGLEAALQWLAEELREETGLDIRVIDDFEPKPLPYEIRATLFQAVRELLLNVAKHAGCGCATVGLRLNEQCIVITVADKGCGFDPADITSRSAKAGGFGLFNVRQRIEHLGGRFLLETAPDTGTTITMQVPLKG